LLCLFRFLGFGRENVALVVLLSCFVCLVCNLVVLWSCFVCLVAHFVCFCLVCLVVGCLVACLVAGLVAGRSCLVAFLLISLFVCRWLSAGQLSGRVFLCLFVDVCFWVGSLDAL
jgi:hypothetical protein